MKRWLGSIIAAAFLIFAPAAQAANSTVSAMTAASALGGTELLYAVQGGADRKATPLQMAAYVYGLMSGDATASGTGAITFATVNANVGSFGSATNCVSLTVNAKGLITAASAAACAPPFSAVTGRTTLAQLPQGIANSIWINPTGSTADMQNVAVPACANDGVHALVYVNGTGLQCASIAAGGTGTVTSVSAGCGTSTGGSPITTTGTVSAALTLRSNTTATDAIVSTDCGNGVYENRATSVAVSIAQAGTAGFGAGTYFLVCNINTGVATITPTTSTIGGASTLAIQAGTAAQPNCVTFQSDGTNYNLLNPPAGSGVAAALGNALSGAGGLSTTVASGTSALGTSAIGSAACATVVTTTATNTATTDVVWWGFNGDPTAVTGYVPLTSGMLTIIAYPSANNVNFKVCNNTSGSITPGAITLNWRVVR
jgi:hypothetical protein